MSRGGKIAGVIVWVLLFALPLVLTGPWIAREIVAWAILAAFLALLGAVGWETAGANAASAVASEPKPATERMSWKQTLAGALIITGVFMGLGSVVLVGEQGFGILVEAVYWQVAALMFVMSLLIGVFLRSAEVTVADVAEDVAHRREARRGRAADVPLLRAARPEERRTWHRRARGLARRGAVVRFVLSAPVCVVVAALTWQVVGGLISPGVGYACTAAAALALEAVVLAAIREQWGDPLLLVGQVTGGVHGIVLEGGKVPGAKDMAVTWLMYGYARTIDVDVREALRLGADGTMQPESKWRGRTTLGARRWLRRTVIQNEDCVLVCAGSGAALSQLGDVAVTTCGERGPSRPRDGTTEPAL